MNVAKRKGTFVVVVIALLVLGFAGAAAAYLHGTGNGSGSATTGTAQPVVLTAGMPSAQLFPGGTADVQVNVSNPNAFSVKLEALSLDTSQGTGGFAVDAGHSGCDPSTLSLAVQDNGGAGWTVPAKVGAVPGSLPVLLANALSMNTAAAQACQGGRFTIFLKAGS